MATAAASVAHLVTATPRARAARGWLVVLPWLWVTGCAPESQLVVSGPLFAPLDASMLTVTVRDGGTIWRWDGADFRARAHNTAPTSPIIDTRSRGDVEVRFQLSAAGATLSEGKVVIPLRDDWRWGVDIRASTEDPQRYCFGCFGAKAFPLSEAFRSPGRDSIWVVWGGNSISHPVVY